MDKLNTSNTEEYVDDVSSRNLDKSVDLLPDEGKNDTPVNNQEVYKATLTAIEDINKIYSPDNAELLEVINQRNALLDEIKTLNDKLANIQEDVLKSNKLYESFKKDFAQSVAEDSWGGENFLCFANF